MANHCKNYSVCGNDTKEISGKPGQFYELCQACKAKENAGKGKDTKPKEPTTAIHIEHGEVTASADGKKFIVPILVVAMKGSDPLKQQTVQVAFNATLDTLGLTDDDGKLSGNYEKIEAEKNAGKTLNLSIFIGTHKSTLKVELPEGKKKVSPMITVQEHEVKLIGDLFQITFEIKTQPAGINVQPKRGVHKLGPQEMTNATDGIILIIREVAKTDAGKTIDFRFVADTGEETQFAVQLPDEGKAKTPCPHCGGKKICKNETTARIKHSCGTCRSASKTSDMLATVSCSFCK